MRAFVKILLLVTLLGPSASQAAETITYTYDARGRLVQVSRSGSINNGAAANYAYDKADNRTTVTTTAGGGGMAGATAPVRPQAQPAGKAAPR